MKYWLYPLCAIGPLWTACSDELSLKDMAEPSEYPETTFGEPTLRRLTNQQIQNAVHDVFGTAIVVPPIAEPDVSLEGFLSIGASTATYSARGVESLENASYAIAEQVLEVPEARSTLLVCQPSSVQDQTCFSAIIEQTGKQLWRRSLSNQEIEQITQVVSNASTVLNDPEQGLLYGLSALLQSPYFLYRVELGDNGVLSATELASRLSFFLWNSIPDAELIDAANSGDLETREGLFAQAKRMLDSPKAKNGVSNFFMEYLKLYQLDSLSKDPTLFEHYSTDLGPDSRQETLQLLEHIIFDMEDDFRTVFTTRESFINYRLASIYNVPVPNDDREFSFIEFPEDSNRAGILGHISFLALNSHAVSTSATLRGRTIRSTLLCQEIPPAPVNVDTSIPEPSGNTLTLRDRVAEHLEDPSCSGCHNLMDPIGLGLENFDSIGRWRVTDNGATIDSSGTLDDTSFQNALELGYAISNHDNLGYCLARSFSRYAIGRVESSGEDELLAVLEERLDHHNYQIKPLLLEIIMSPLFQQVGLVQEVQ